MYTGPEFLLYLRYAQLLNTLFVCLMFSSGMPILIPIACVTFIGYYFVDKFMLFNFYSLPPMLGSALASAVTDILPYAVLMHLMFGMWMMSNEEFFSASAGVAINPNFGNSTDTLGVGVDVGVLDASQYFGDNVLMQTVWDRFTHGNCYIMLFVFVALVVVMLWNRVIVKILKANKGFLAVFPCLKKILSFQEEAEGNEPYLKSISHERLDIQVRQNLLDDEIIEKYKAELERRKNTTDYKKSEKEIDILESYNFYANSKYVEAFASDASSVIEYDELRKEQRKTTMKGAAVMDAPDDAVGEGDVALQVLEKQETL
jgi:hypothetical protein